MEMRRSRVRLPAVHDQVEFSACPARTRKKISIHLYIYITSRVSGENIYTTPSSIYHETRLDSEGDVYYYIAGLEGYGDPVVNAIKLSWDKIL